MVKLNIGFFGSDRFSILSFQLLLQLQKQRPDLINSLELVARAPKMFKKRLTDLPILSAFPDVKLRRADTRRELLALRDTCSFNLLIAVSYGKLIPQELIASMRYGGLNVHPSSLPKYSGSSPVQCALINDDSHTGVTVQTLHPTKFDKGDILVQRNHIPIEESDNYDSLIEKLGLIGGDALSKCIEDRLFINPNPISPEFEYSLATKFETQDKQIFWEKYTARQIFKRYQALGPLFTRQRCEVYSRLQKRDRSYSRRVILDDIKIHGSDDRLSLAPGDYRMDDDKRLRIGTIDNLNISVGTILMETFTKETPEQFMAGILKKIGRSKAKFTDEIKK